jgi:hypothetical protein
MTNRKLSDIIELAIAIDVATSGCFYQKNNWNKHTSKYAGVNDYINFKFQIVGKYKDDIHSQGWRLTQDVTNRQRSDNPAYYDLDHEIRLGAFISTNITQYIPYTAEAVKTLEELDRTMKGISLGLTTLFAKKPENSTKQLRQGYDIVFANALPTHIETLRQKAKKWDELKSKLESFYFDENGEELGEENCGDLVNIGEEAARAFRLI